MSSNALAELVYPDEEAELTAFELQQCQSLTSFGMLRGHTHLCDDHATMGAVPEYA